MENIAHTIPEGSPRNFFEDLEILNFHFFRRFFLSLDLNSEIKLVHAQRCLSCKVIYTSLISIWW